MAPIEISFIGTFSYELRGGNSLIPWNSAGGFEVGPKKPGGERNLSYKIYFLGHFYWDTTTPIYDEDCLRAHLAALGFEQKKLDEAFGDFLVVFWCFFCSMLGGKLPGAVLDVFFSDLQMFVFIFRR